MKLSAIKIMEGEAAPWWYGFAYRLENEAAIVCYPVPLNLAARWIRSAWRWVRMSPVERQSESYRAGFAAGQRYGERVGVQKERESIRERIHNAFEDLRRDNDERRRAAASA